MLPTLDSDLMRSFLVLADSGSMTEAADRIGRTQSAMSVQIRKLEENLGQQLFHRRPRGVELTERGAQLLPYARRVVGILDEAALALRERPLQGPVRVGISEDYGESVLPRALAAFGKRHPDVDVTVRVDYSGPQMAALAADEIDLAVVFEPASAIKGEVLCIDPTVWVTSIEHEQHLITPLPVTRYFNSHWCQETAHGSLDRSGIAYRVAYECDTTGGFMIAVRSGLAIAPLSRSTIPPGCRELTEADGFAPVENAAVVLYRNPRGTSDTVRGLADALRDAFGPLAQNRAIGVD